MPRGFVVLLVLIPIVLLLTLSIRYFSLSSIESNLIPRHAHAKGVMMQRNMDQFIHDRFLFSIHHGLRDPLLIEESLNQDLRQLPLLFPDWQFNSIPVSAFKVLTIPLPEKGYVITLFLVPASPFTIQSPDESTQLVVSTHQQWVEVTL